MCLRPGDYTSVTVDSRTVGSVAISCNDDNAHMIDNVLTLLYVVCVFLLLQNYCCGHGVIINQFVMRMLRLSR